MTTEQQAWPIESIEKDPGSDNYGVMLKGAHSGAMWFTADELAAAGITPPAPDINFDELPDGTIVHYKHSNAHRIMRDGRWCDLTDGSAVSMAGPEHYTVVHVPAAPDTYPFGDPDGPDCPKMVRETLCVAQGVVGRWVIDDRRDEYVARIGRLIDICDRHRPLGPNGKHRTAHCTPTCGCEDKRDVQDLAPAAPDLRTALHTLGYTDEQIARLAWLHDTGTYPADMIPVVDAAREVTP